jgi:hypothetical protein
MGRHYLMRAEMRALRLADAVVTVDTLCIGTCSDWYPNDPIASIPS